MTITKNTASKRNYQNLNKKSGTAGKKSKIKKTFDFSDGKFSFKINVSQIITLILFAGSIGWFFAAYWVFDIRSEKLKNNIKNEIREEMSEKMDNLNGSKMEKTEADNLKAKIDKYQSIMNCLEIKGYFTKECFK